MKRSQGVWPELCTEESAMIGSWLTYLGFAERLAGPDVAKAASGPHMNAQCTLPDSPSVSAASKSEASNISLGNAKLAPARCLHCQAPLAASDVAGGFYFCCRGCEHASALLTRLGAQSNAGNRESLGGVACNACVPVDAPSEESSSLLLRLGICLGLAGNSMAFSFAVYFGLDASAGSLFRFVGYANLVLATLVLLIGGSYFLKGAWRSLRARRFDLDVPLAMSVVLAYSGAVWVFFRDALGATYFDTFSAYVALMLVGRYLPARLIERNRHLLGSEDGLAALPQQMLDASGVVRTDVAGNVKRGSSLLVLPGDLFVVASSITTEALVTLDWLSGEPEPVSFSVGSTVPAGAINVGTSAVQAEALSDYSASPLRVMLDTADVESHAREHSERAHQRFSQVFVFGTLAWAALTFAVWSRVDVQQGWFATICVLVVACPCAIGLGAPVALELTLRRLRNAGVFLRRPEALGRLASVDSVAFDKTGTLTELTVSESSLATIGELPRSHQLALATMCARSNHPVARAVRQALPDCAEAYGTTPVIELPSVGLRMGDYVLRRDDAAGHRLVFTLHDSVLAMIDLGEKLRADAVAETRALAQLGVSLAVLSGDRAARVSEVTQVLGLEDERIKSELSSAQKAQWITQHPAERVLVVGDGINDLAAFGVAHASGTPAIDRPFVPARSDFYYRARGLWPVREALLAARAYARAVRFDYLFAGAYNLIVLSVASLGLMTPLIAALLMPASSLLLVSANVLLVRPTHALEKTPVFSPLSPVATMGDPCRS